MKETDLDRLLNFLKYTNYNFSVDNYDGNKIVTFNDSQLCKDDDAVYVEIEFSDIYDEQEEIMDYQARYITCSKKA